MNISIVIPNYNGASALNANFQSVIDAFSYFIDDEKVKGEIILVDDDSTDNSVDIIKNFQKKSRKIEIKLIEQSKNCGFSSSVNRGVKESSYEVVVLLNTDVKPERDFLFPLLVHFSDSKVFAVGCIDKSIESGNVVLRGRGVGEWKRGLLSHSRGSIDKSSTLWVSGGSGAFRKKTWDILGGMYEIYNPFYWEDVDLSYRAMKAGYKIIFESKSIVTHFHETGAIKTYYTPSKVKFVSYKNQIIFAWINISDIDLLIMHLVWLPFMFFSALIHRNKYFIQGFFHAVIHIHEVLNLRKITQQFIVKSDKEVTKLIK